MAQLERYKSKYKNKKLKESFYPKDDILTDFTFEDLIDTIYSNEPIKNKASVEKVFNEMIKTSINEAKYELKTNMREIISYFGKVE